jgi:hypothetical protein
MFLVPMAITIYAMWGISTVGDAIAELALAKHYFLINDSRCLIYVKKTKALLEQRAKQFKIILALVLLLVPFEALSTSGHTTESGLYIFDLCQFACFGMAFVSCYWHMSQSLLVNAEVGFVSRHIEQKKDAWKTNIK